MFHHGMTIGSIVAFITYSSYVLGPVSTILNIGYKLSGIVPSMDRYRSLYDVEIEEDKENNSNIARKGINNIISIERVSFFYNSDNLILNNLNTEIKENKLTVILGENGKGKTTLINMLLRLIRATSGSIKLDGMDINSIPLSQYRDKISFVGQEPFLFCDTLKNNLTLYRDIQDDRIMDICIKCGLKELVRENSLDYNVGNRGMKLSGGQRQKVALARALLSDCRYIILDEISSNMDEKSKRNLCKILNQYKREKTIIVVSHDNEILAIADEIIRL